MASCSDDKDDVNPAARLVGTWVCEDSYGIDMYTFNSNGTGVNYYEEKGYSDTDYFNWTATETTLTITYPDYPGEYDKTSYTISPDGKRLTMWGEEYYRQ
ncbi:MAG: lipocalin family protein [Duncaniella sp.]|nr:lipocalin family protein [Duncaniella sp.]